MEKTSFSHNDVELLDRQEVYKGFFKMEKVSLRHRLFAGGWSATLSRELFVRGTAVAAIIYDPALKVIGMVEQFRIGLVDDHKRSTGPWCLEVVAGMTEPNETPEQVMLRELQEEAGIVPDKLVHICDYYSSPGGTSERLDLYCAVADLSNAGELFGLPEEGEDIRLVVLPEEDVFTSLYGGQYNNAATLICLQWLQMHREQLVHTQK